MRRSRTRIDRRSVAQRHARGHPVTHGWPRSERLRVGQGCRLRASHEVGQGRDLGRISVLRRGVTKEVSHIHQGTIVPSNAKEFVGPPGLGPAAKGLFVRLSRELTFAGDGLCSGPTADCRSWGVRRISAPNAKQVETWRRIFIGSAPMMPFSWPLKPASGM